MCSSKPEGDNLLSSVAQWKGILFRSQVQWVPPELASHEGLNLPTGQWVGWASLLPASQTLSAASFAAIPTVGRGAGTAQSTERRTRDQKVANSIPAGVRRTFCADS